MTTNLCPVCDRDTDSDLISDRMRGFTSGVFSFREQILILTALKLMLGREWDENVRNELSALEAKFTRLFTTEEA